MAESHIPEDMAEEEQPFEVDPELIDDADDDGGIPARAEPVEKKRGRKPKHPQNPQDGGEARRRAFVESNVKTSLAKTDMMEVMNRYDWESGDYDVSILRVQPQTWHSRNIQGYIAAFPHFIDENFISENFGGGVYDLKIRGPNPRQGGASKGFLDGCRVKISGEPKVSPMDKSMVFDGGGIMLRDPQGGPPSQRLINEIKSQEAQQRRSDAAWEREQNHSQRMEHQDPGLIKMSFNSLMERERQTAKEAASLRDQLIENSSRQNNGDGLTREALRLVRESADKAIESERLSAERLQEAASKHREEFEKMIERMGNQKVGIPPEMLQTLTEQHRSELASVNEARMSQLNQAQERYEREIGTLRERYERELSIAQDRSQEALNQIRSELQGRIDRQDEQYKREMDRERERFQSDFSKAQEDWQRRNDHFASQSVSEREALGRSHQMHVDHMKALHQTQIDQITATLKSQVDQERSQRDSLVAQLNAQHEAQIKMMEVSYRSQIENLNAELTRTRGDLDSMRQKVNDQGDLATQAEKLKKIGDSLHGVFGLGGAALAPVQSGDSDYERPEPEPKSFFGKFMQFANSDMGAGLFDFLKSAAGAAAVGAYPGGGFPMPGAPGLPQTYGPPQGFNQVPQQVYGQPQYGAPPSPYVYNQPIPGQQGRVVEDNPEDEYIEEGDEGVEEGAFVDDAQQAEPAGPSQETPRIHSTVNADGVITMQRPQEQKRPEASNATQQIPPEALQQMKVLVKGLEESMNNGVSAAMLAQTIAPMAPPGQLKPFADTPIGILINEIAQVSPGSPLTTYNGKKYIAALQQELRKFVG